MARKLQVEIVGDTSSLERAYGRAGKQTSTLGTKLKTLGRVAGLATLALGGGMAAGLAIGVKGLMAHEQADARLANVLETTGNTAGTSVEKIGRLADAIEKKSGMDDVAAKSGAALLLTFKDIRNEAGQGNDVFDRAVGLMADLSAATGKDMPASSKILGKALNDPIRGLSQLRRVGVTFTKQQEEQIKKMTEAGDVIGAQKILLQGLEERYGGAAKAAGETLGGRLNILKARLEEVAEKVAARVLPSFERLVGWVEDNWPTIQEVIEGVFDAIAAAWDTLQPVFSAIVDEGKKVVQFFSEHETTAKALAIALGGLAVAVWAVNIAMAANPVVLVTAGIVALGLAVAALIIHFEEVKSWVLDHWPEVASAFLGPIAIVAGLLAGEDPFGIKGAVNGVITWIGQQAATAYTTMKNWGEELLRGAWDGIKDLAAKVGGAIASAIQAVVDKFVAAYTAAKGLGGKIVGGVSDAITGAGGVIAKVGETIGKIPGKIREFFEGVKTAASELGGKILSGIGEGLRTLGQKLREWIATPINAILGGIDAIKIPGFSISIPGVGPIPDINFGWGGADPFPPMPRLAEGGIVRKPTVALIGEEGPEAVIPLGRMPSVELHFHVGTVIGTDFDTAVRQMAEPMRAELQRIQRRLGGQGLFA